MQKAAYEKATTEYV